jgi:hypothetical protein
MLRYSGDERGKKKKTALWEEENIILKEEAKTAELYAITTKFTGDSHRRERRRPLLL